MLSQNPPDGRLGIRAHDGCLLTRLMQSLKKRNRTVEQGDIRTRAHLADIAYDEGQPPAWYPEVPYDVDARAVSKRVDILIVQLSEFVLDGGRAERSQCPGCTVGEGTIEIQHNEVIPVSTRTYAQWLQMSFFSVTCQISVSLRLVKPDAKI
jgi:hypothetical protein